MIRYRAFQIAVAAAFAASPFFGIPGWTVSLATVVAFTSLGLLGLNLVFGVLGMLAFGQAAFVALPGYAAGVLEHAGMPTPPAIALGVLGTVGVARLVAEIFVRLPGVYFAVGTLGFAFVVEGIARAFPEWTGGASGLVFAEGRAISAEAWYAASLAALVAGVAAYAWLLRDRRARSMHTIRHDELAASVIGIEVARTKVRIFTVASAFCSVAGICLAYYVGVLVPESAGVNRSLEYVGTVLLGGLATALGPIVGTALVQWLFVVAGYGNRYELLVYGIAFLGAVLYARHGIVGLARGPWERLSRRLRERPRHHREEPPGLEPPPAAAFPAAGEAIRVAAVSKYFGGVQALSEVSFDVHYGEIFALVGPNGAGKSTLFNIVSGIEPPSAGTVLLDGEDLAPRPIHRRAPLIGRSFQVARLVPELTALENVAARLDQILPSLPERQKRALAWEQLSAFGLSHLAGRPVRELAVGQHKLIDLARAAVGEPKLVLLDEPAVGLSDGELEHLRELLTRLRARARAVIVVEHNIDFVASVADRGVVLDGGVVIAHGPIADILKEPRVLEAYFGVLE